MTADVLGAVHTDTAMGRLRPLARALALFVPVMLSGCGPSKIGGITQATPILSQADTINLEDSDRIARFRRLAQIDGIASPIIQQIFAPPGSVPGVPGQAPVVRVVFPEGVFFNSNNATPLPRSIPVIDLVAQNMRRDVPDAALTILGHTDSTGTDAYNMKLSERRALSVMALLADRGVDPLQMTTVAIGDHQPIAPNDTPQGRARNWRVEFLISASPEANLAVVQHRTINPAFLETGEGAPKPKSPSKETVTVLQGQRVNLNGLQKLALVPVGPLEISAAPATTGGPVTSKALAPPPIVTMRPAAPVTPAQLSNIIVQ